LFGLARLGRRGTGQKEDRRAKAPSYSKGNKRRGKGGRREKKLPKG